MSKTSKQKFILLRKLWRTSQTKLWAYTQASSGAVLLAIPGINHFLNSSEFNSLLSKFTVPAWVGIGIAVFGCISYIAHGHDA